jgi:uncharacterized membrane protein YfcA
MNGWLLGYLALGAVAGFFAGLLGVGGGAIMVPVLALMFSAQGFPQKHLMHLALGTSMATIVFTSISSLRAHHRHGAVRWPIVRDISPGIIIGTLLGTQIAGLIPTRLLAIIFTCFIAYVAAQMILNVKPQPTRQLPDRVGMLGVGIFIGGISALVGIGGGSMSVPFMTWCNIRVHQAIGTSAAIGFPIALAGIIGYFIAGQGATSLPDGAWGFIYLPALVAMVVVSMLIAPLGARIAHRLPVPVIRKIFAVLLLILLGKMLYGLI